MLRIITAVFFLLLCCAAPAFAGHYLFVSLDFPPLVYQKEGSPQPEGAAVEIVRRIMSRLNHTAEIRIYGWENAVRMTRDGSADAIFPMMKNSEREAFSDFSSEPLISQAIVLYSKKGVEPVFTGDFAALKGKRVGVVSTLYYGPVFQKARPKLNIVMSYTLESNLKMLARGNLDYVIAHIWVAESLLKKTGLDGEIVRVPAIIEQTANYAAFPKSRKNTILRGQFDAELRKMKASGEYGKILASYGYGSW